MDDDIFALINEFPPITLEEMSSIRLMNRTDAKFLTNKATLMKLLAYAKGEYFAQQIDGKRINAYRTTYYDTPDHRFYTTHHNGLAPRVKVRVRTYIDSDITFLEVKRKNNHGRTKKKRIKIASPNAISENGGEDFLFRESGLKLDNLLPSLRNRFDRITLVNRGKTERLTIDFNVTFENMETGDTCGTNNLVIVELKRDGNVYSPIKEMLLRLRIKPGGYSKYCIGSMMTNKTLKQNLFKERMNLINKIANN
ncbi:MAG: polyphosphate polymerase domain-containing protein [Bacteroidaceae bacterium]